ncbi:MAG: gene transfer agent family protein [Salinarimonas sp.]|nr:gene transfer agent family protein [Salinarimonas sp.]
MVNRRRGETELVLGERRYRLCLTLGALAELEAAFGLDDLASLAERFNTGRLAAQDVITILGCALRGGGHDLSEAEVAALHGPEGVGPLVEAALAALEAAFGVDAPNPPRAQTG